MAVIAEELNDRLASSTRTVTSGRHLARTLRQRRLFRGASRTISCLTATFGMARRAIPLPCLHRGDRPAVQGPDPSIQRVPGCLGASLADVGGDARLVLVQHSAVVKLNHFTSTKHEGLLPIGAIRYFYFSSMARYTPSWVFPCPPKSAMSSIMPWGIARLLIASVKSDIRGRDGEQ